ncbi:SUN domain-containing ossification factor isoform X1 [Leptinotarsa decemlineata]|uniref:SUN domain-containing ossification factor isoform X1 n=1 Tax=Leptinotarsa decemlineata TaxID=7539 RepID=UPI003D307BF0
MNTRTTNTHLIIVSLIFLNIPILLAIITIHDQDGFSQSLEVQNETEQSIPKSVQDSGSDLEPSVELNLEVVNVDSGSKELTDNTTENSDVVTRTLPNDTPVLLQTDSSPVDLEHIAEVSLVLTSQNGEIGTQNIAAATENIPSNISSNISNVDVENLTESTQLETESEGKNITEDKSEDIPSFSEWAQKRLEEVEKNKQSNESVKGQVINGKHFLFLGKGMNPKLRWKNYASLDCGAKVVGANSESVSPGSILSPAVDEYKLSPCTSRIWFVVELCEAIQAQRIDLANYELFSSSPKDFTVSVSERFPTKDWVIVGKFTAKDEKDIQSFDIETQLFGKYIKVEIKSHYGTEHYCPISLFRAYGMSVFEVLQKEDPGNENTTDQDDDDDDDDDEEILNIDHNPGKAQKNVFTSATDAVISMVKRAAEALGNKVDNETVFVKKSNASTLVNTCSSPRHVIVCNNCSETLFGQIFELLSCKAEEISKLVSIPAIMTALLDSDVCRRFGYEFNPSFKETIKLEHFEAFFPEKYLGAMCNEAAILEKQGLLNVSHQFLNVTKTLTKDKIINMNIEDSEEPKLSTNDTFVENIEVVDHSDTPSSTTSEDVSQIKPTKTFSLDPNLTQTVVEAEDPRLESITESPETTTVTSHEITIENPLSVEVEATTEGAEILEEHIDHIADMNIDNPSTAVPSSTSTNSPQAPKESIFMRLSNRIKALERNMSLSSQYLEELSKRYKKQVEEMQLLLEKTVATMHEKTQERAEQNKQLEERLDHLTASIEELTAERRFFFSVVYFLLLFVFICTGFRFFCRTWSKSRHKSEEMDEVLSLVSEESTKAEKRRRPSDQVLKIVRYSSINDDERHRRAKKRKKKAAKRSNSVGSLKIKDEDWAQNTHQVIEDVPFLDENDTLTLEACTFPNDFSKSDSPGRLIEEDSSLQITEPSVNYLKSTPSEPVKKEKKGFKKFLKKVF